MASNSQEDGQIVVSKEITLTSPPGITYGSNNAESSSQNMSALSKNEEQLKSSEQDDNAENKGVVAENLPSHNNEAIAVDNEPESSHIEEEINICDTCGDKGFQNLLFICSRCEIGAEHTYCMTVKVADPQGWLCYDCTEDKDGVRDGEETSSVERKPNMEERRLSQKQPDLLSNGLNSDLNVDPHKDMNEEPSSNKRRIGPSIDCPKMAEEASSSQAADLLNTKRRRHIPWLDLNKDPNPDFDEDPNINLNVDP